MYNDNIVAPQATEQYRIYHKLHLKFGATGRRRVKTFNKLGSWNGSRARKGVYIRVEYRR